MFFKFDICQKYSQGFIVRPLSSQQVWRASGCDIESRLLRSIIKNIDNLQGKFAKPNYQILNINTIQYKILY